MHTLTKIHLSKLVLAAYDFKFHQSSISYKYQTHGYSLATTDHANITDAQFIRNIIYCTLEAPLSCSGLSAFKKLEFPDTLSEELGDDSRSITELVCTGDRRGIGLVMWFCFPSDDWKAITWILPT